MRTATSKASNTCSPPQSFSLSSSNSSPTSSQSSNYSSSITTIPSILSPPPSNSPSSFVPFSWEKKAGVPKPDLDDSSTTPLALPLPPPHRPKPSRSGKKRPDYLAADPFAAAFVECSKPCPSDERKSEQIPVRRTARDRFGLVLRHKIAWDPLGSCRSNRAVAEPTTYVRRPGQQMVAHDLLNRPR